MANFAKIEIQFTDFSSSQGAELKIEFAGSSTYNLLWSSEVIRTIAYTYTISLIDEYDQASLVFAAISADIANHGNLQSKMVVTKSADTITIEANEYGWAITDDGTTLDVEATLTPTAEVLPTKDFQLLSSSLAAASVAAPCGNIELTITSNSDGVGPFTWISPSLSSTTSGQTTYAEVSRQAALSSLNVTIQDADTDQATLNNIQIPPIFTALFISSISSVGNAGGLDSTVTVFMTDTSTHGSLFSYTYSLDGINFQVSNVFPGIVDGSYTLYVNDGFGCVITQGFTADAATTIQRRTALELVPIANSLRFVNQEVTQFDTYENTLYQDVEYLGEHTPFYAQPYEHNDGIVLTQFRSNYDSLSARVLDCDDNIISTSTITKKSDNLDARQKMDCIGFNLGDNQIGLYFISGNIYDPSDDSIIDTFTLNGNLPEWGVVGNTVIISGQFSGSYIIKKVQYDSSVLSNILVIDQAWTSGNATEALIGDCTYDRLNYEAYEFPIDLSALASGTYKAQILMEDSLSEYPDVSYISEWFKVATEHIRTNYLEYYNSPFTGIDYTTGFIGKLRVKSLDPYNKIKPGGEILAYKDNLFKTTKLKDVATMEGLFYVMAVPRYMVEKLRLAFAHLNISINGEEWVNEELLEYEDFDHSALRNVTVQLRKVNYEEYGTDIIDIDGDKEKLITTEGAILQ